MLPALHYFVWASHARFYIMLLPFSYIELRALIEHVHRRAAPVVRRLAPAILAAGIAAAVAPSLQRHRDGAAQRSAWRAIMRPRAEHDNVLVFMASPPPSAHVYQS